VKRRKTGAVRCVLIVITTVLVPEVGKRRTLKAAD